MINIINKTPLKFVAKDEDLTAGTEITPKQFVSKTSNPKKGLIVCLERGNGLNPLIVSTYESINKAGKKEYHARGAKVLREGVMHDNPCIGNVFSDEYLSEINEYENEN